MNNIEQDNIDQIFLEFKERIRQEIERQVRQRLKEKAAEISPLGVAERQKRREENLQKILQLAQEKGEITNDMVQKEVLVAHDTATDYLNILVERGDFQAIGEPEHRSYKLLSSAD